MSRSAVLRALVVLAAAAAPGCASADPCGVRWEPIVAHEGAAPVERIRAGRPDAADPRPQFVGVDQAGDVVLVRMDGERPASEVVHRHGAETTGLAIADVDPSVPGEEIYVGGYAAGSGAAETGGEVVQVVVGPGGPRARRVWAGGAYVHSIEVVRPRGPEDPVRLLLATYAGELRLLTPAAGDAWTDTLVFRDTGTTEKEALKMKDVALLRDASGAPPHEALVVAKTGRAHLVDLDRPSAARLVHVEEGGLSRAEPDPSGGAYVCGYFGRAMHFRREGDGFRVVPMDHEGRESGLRGFTAGRFPVPCGEGAFAVFGYHALCRVLTLRNGAWDATTVFADDARGHTILAADVVPGNDADEIVLGGHSKRITVLVVRR